MDRSLKERIAKVANRLVPVAGFLMFVATSNGRCARWPEEHEEGCECQTCTAFLTVQSCITELSGLADTQA